jgi:3-hydroxybutyryl-CoA dehydrogenase
VEGDESTVTGTSADHGAAPTYARSERGPLDGAVIGVIGAGTMGAGIAHVAAFAGHEVLLYDIAEEYVQRGVAGIAGFLRRGAEKGKYEMRDAELAIARLRPTTQLEDLAPCGLVIEAAPERLSLKQELFGKLEAIVGPHAILATNTSTLSVAAIGAPLTRPARLCGMHFFNPAPLMPLVELIEGPETEAAVTASLRALAEAWGKRPVVARDTPGFIVNRVARPYYGEALRLLGEGAADVATLDRLLADGGFPMGPFQLMDLIGIDINYAAAHSVYDGFFQDPRFRPHPIQRQMVESGRLGRKSGRGYYDYRPREAQPGQAGADAT